ncbi:hypothetical protein F3J41_09885 [Pantoea sp. Ap-870]|nr:hypothetical protein F3I21_16090 [Pantoea sp. B_9]KAA6107279.1 hypothetical protein F3I18_22340 [Pantoea sp. B_10]NIE52362.1 hypothetical protein [Pantoea sp. Ap-870]NIG35055.1 hypothetical protein [Pantoea sp. Ap-959]PPC67613.1 hypothetical protein C1Y43_12750 [Pantoea sp. ICBG 828]
MQLIPVFCTKLSTEKVNKIAVKYPCLFITWLLSVSYPIVIRSAARISSGLPPVRSMKQSGYSNLALR